MDLEGIKLNEVSPMDKFHIIILIFSIKNLKKKKAKQTQRTNSGYQRGLERGPNG